MKKAVLLVFLLACPEIQAMAAAQQDTQETSAKVFTAGEITVSGK